MKHLLKALGILTFTISALNASAQEGSKGTDMGGMKMEPAKATKLTDGEVKKVDATAGHVTLKHGAIENMNMGPMTMTFAVKDKSSLLSLKEGSKVRFAVENVDGMPTVTTLVPQK